MMLQDRINLKRLINHIILQFNSNNRILENNQDKNAKEANKLNIKIKKQRLQQQDLKKFMLKNNH